MYCKEQKARVDGGADSPKWTNWIQRRADEQDGILRLGWNKVLALGIEDQIERYIPSRRDLPIDTLIDVIQYRPGEISQSTVILVKDKFGLSPILHRLARMDISNCQTLI